MGEPLTIPGLALKMAGQLIFSLASLNRGVIDRIFAGFKPLVRILRTPLENGKCPGNDQYHSGRWAAKSDEPVRQQPIRGIYRGCLKLVRRRGL